MEDEQYKKDEVFRGIGNALLLVLIFSVIVVAGFVIAKALECNVECQNTQQAQYQYMQTQLLVAEQARVAHEKELAAIEAAKTPEQKLMEQQVELQRRQAESMKYLEQSRQVHDTLEVISLFL